MSTSQQEKFGYSLEAQVHRFKQYASMLNLSVTDIAVEAESAKDTRRPQLQMILNKVHKKQIDHFVTLKLCRLSRETVDAITLAKTFAKKGCKLHLVSEGGVVDLTDPMQEMVFTIKAATGRLERRRISLNTKFGLDRKRDLGQRISGQAPYGHKFVDGKVVIDDHEQKIIRRVHQLHSEGYSQRNIIKQLTAEHIRNREGHTFTRPTISSILTKEIIWN